VFARYSDISILDIPGSVGSADIGLVFVTLLSFRNQSTLLLFFSSFLPGQPQAILKFLP
jgi:hypothetical protein